MFTTIVVGTDGSDSAAIAVREAVELAKATGAALHIVHAFQPMNIAAVAMSAGTGGPAVDVERVNQSIEQTAHSVCDHATAKAQEAGVTVETHMEPGDPSDALVTVAERVHADLLVVGNRGMTGVKRFVLGSVPNKISHHAPCSVLIVDTSH
ncbi:MAG: universal stress protein [Acidimicrobiia bacterium]